MTQAIFIGRFQPFHKGHLKAVTDILKEHDTIIICIGSAQEARTEQNPLSYKQRKEMITYAINDANIPKKRYSIIAITDINNDDLWVGHVGKHCPKFDIVYTGNPHVKKLFKRSGYKVKDIAQYKDINSSTIRKRIIQDMEWKKYIPNAVAYYLDDIGFEKLIKMTKSSKELTGKKEHDETHNKKYKEPNINISIKNHENPD
ncbi:MAG: nicotinamide-nucleotide adenylyltransferase [Candidatus Aenigmarchaeota archaeon]|nr:nicotinamide-nucleotide adenylyltransferase [Candidatus Aenigmarchaeota archaeon]